MIAYINGVLTHIKDETILVDVNGIGYEILCANPFVFQSKLNELIHIHTYHHVREDIQALYGFKHEEEKQLFTKLISVSGIGPKSGIGILGTVNVQDFVRAVEQEDDKYLMQFPGVGKKTARQIILDLKGKLTEFSVQAANEFSKSTEQSSEHLSELEDALTSLGYTSSEIRAVLPTLRESSHLDLNELIKNALALLAKS